jgi:hypothetical protein
VWVRALSAEKPFLFYGLDLEWQSALAEVVLREFVDHQYAPKIHEGLGMACSSYPHRLWRVVSSFPGISGPAPVRCSVRLTRVVTAFPEFLWGVACHRHRWHVRILFRPEFRKTVGSHSGALLGAPNTAPLTCSRIGFVQFILRQHARAVHRLTSASEYV